MSEPDRSTSQHPEIATRQNRGATIHLKEHNCAKATDFKCEIDYAIWRKVHGKPSPWLLDSKFKDEGSCEDRFNSGDHQILLWELHDCARIGRCIPKWAADALYKILYDMAKGGGK